MEKDTEELLILGNGFDIKRQLKTKYDDFMKWEESTNSENLWVHILKQAHIKDAWYDVENTIKDVLLGFYPHILVGVINLTIESHKSDILPFFNQDSGKLGDIKESVNTYAPDFGGNTKENVKFIKSIACAIHKNVNASLTMTLDSLNDYDINNSRFEDFIEEVQVKGTSALDALLKEELHDFETLFTNYLVSQNTTSEVALERSQSLISRIVGKREGKNIDILNFNYTNPLVVTNRKKSNNSLNNVHGTIESQNIIFGIDLTEDFKTEPIPQRLVPFTKTFRKMTLPTPDEWILPKSPEYIRAYGHSLSAADYSYFQTIYDYVDLYNSNVVLEFCFSVFPIPEYDTNAERKAYLENKQAESVYQLINTYGSTFNNPDQGKNLLHKLLVENRLKIREI